ncbi:hypothetical protein [Micromonospora pisi]|nr:hypothetical protein [Micromonospora pisi]
MAAVFWAIFGLAVWSHHAGDPTVVNGIIGAGFGAILFTGLAWVDRD